MNYSLRQSLIWSMVCCLVISLSLPYAHAENQKDDNLISNGSFEEPVVEGNIPGWDTWVPSGDPTISIVDDESVDGDHSLHIVGDSGDDRGALSRSIRNIETGETYELSYWSKTKDIQAHGLGVTTRVQFKDGQGADIAAMIYVGNPSGTTDWTQHSHVLDIPEGTSYIKLEPILDQATGEVWFDDFTLRKLAPSEINLISNGSFEEPVEGGNIPGWNTWVPSGDPTISIVDDESVDGDHSLHIVGDSGDDRGALSRSIRVEAGGTYAFSYWSKTEDIDAHGVGVTTRVQFKDGQGADTAAMIYVGNPSGTTDWTRFTHMLEIPEHTSHIRVEPILDKATGEVWFDDFVLTTVDTSQPPEFISFTANLLETGAVQLAWNVSYGYPDQVTFKVYRSTEEDFDPQPELLIDTTNDNHFLDRATSVDETYYYRIVLIDESDSMSVTEIKAVTVTQALPPGTADEFGSVAHLAGGASLSWVLDGESRANTVRLYASDEPMDEADSQFLVDEVSAAETEYHYEVSDAPQYYGIVVVDADGGESGWMTTELKWILPPVDEEAKNLVHPYLFFHADEIPYLKEKVENEAAAKRAFKELIAQAEAAVEEVLEPDFQLPEKDSDEHDRLADYARDAALAYTLTDEEAYREAAITILTAYGDGYADYPLTGTYDGRLLYQTLNEAGWLIDFTWAYDMMYEELSDEQRHKIETDVLYNAVDVISRYKRGLSNWQVWHNAAIGMVALVTKDQALLERVVNDPAQGLKYEMEDGIRLDGLWWEEANSYHHYTLTPFIYFAEAAYNSNLDMYTLTTEHGTSLKTMFDALQHYVFADMTRPAIGNSSLYAPLTSGFLYEIAYKRYQDPKYAWLVQQTLGENREEKTLTPHWSFVFSESDLPQVNYEIKSGPFAPLGENVMGSTLYHDTGMAILRNHEQADMATNVSMNWSPHGTTNGHQHADMLGIMLFGNGETLLTEAGQLGYNNAAHISWAKQTLAHNTLVVDETSQYPQEDLRGLWESDQSGRPSSGVLTNHHIGPWLKTITAESDTVYDGVHLTRSLIMVDDYVVDWFQAESDTAHQYDLPYHVNGHLVDTSLEFETYEGEPIRDWGGYQHISDMSTAATDNQWSTTWRGNKGSGLKMTMTGESDTEIVHGTAMNELVMARRQGENADFLTVLQPFTDDAPPPSIQPLPIDANSPAHALEIGSDGNKDIIGVGRGGEQKTVAGMTFDGTIAYAKWENGRPTHTLAFTEGQSYHDDEQEIQLSETGSLQMTELHQPHTYRLDYNGAEQSNLELTMPLHSNTKVMAYDPVTDQVTEHDYTITDREGAKRHLQMTVQSGMTYLLMKPPYNDEWDLELSAEVAPLYDQVTEPEISGQVIPVSETLAGIVVEGEDYTGEGGTLTRVEVDEKPGASGGKAIRLWDYAGHWLEWTADVPETGTYQVVIRYSTDTETSYRDFTFGGSEENIFHFPSTHGWDNWRDVVLADLDENPLTFELTRGEHTIHMTNLSSPLNVDYFKLVKVATRVEDSIVLVERFEDEGAFANDQAVHALKIHLTAVSHFEKQDMAEKVVKHLKSFRLLLDHQRDEGVISEDAYHALMESTDDLISRWQ